MNKLDKYCFTRKRESYEISELEMLCIQIEATTECIGSHFKKRTEALDRYMRENDSRSYEDYLRASLYVETARKELATLQTKFEKFLSEKSADYSPQIVFMCFFDDISFLPEELQNLVKEAREKLGIMVGEETKAGDSKPKQQGEEE